MFFIAFDISPDYNRRQIIFDFKTSYIYTFRARVYMEEFFNFNEEVADLTTSKDDNFLSLFQRFNRLTKRKIKDLYVDNIPDQSIKKMKPICTYE